MFNFNKSVDLALKTWYPLSHILHYDSRHPLMKLVGEQGELLDDYAKSIYKPGYEFDPIDELGDIWYYIRILCYQKKVVPVLIDHAIFPELGMTIVFSECEVDILIRAAIYSINRYALIKEINTSRMTFFILEMSIQYSILEEICKRFDITLEQLTKSNWEKLKPGSERGEQWTKVGEGSEYVGGKIAKR